MRLETFVNFVMVAALAGCGSPTSDKPEVDAGNVVSTEETPACNATPVDECAVAGCMVITGSPIVECEVESAQAAGCAELDVPINAIITCAIEAESGVCYRFPSSLVPATFAAATCEQGACLSGAACVRGPYDACDGKSCGADCDPCDPFDPACPNRGEMLTCDQQGECLDSATVECTIHGDAAVFDDAAARDDVAVP